MTAAGMVVGGGLGLVVAADPSASAATGATGATGATFTWKIDSESATTRSDHGTRTAPWAAPST